MFYIARSEVQRERESGGSGWEGTERKKME